VRNEGGESALGKVFKRLDVVVLPQFATKNHAVTLSLLAPPQWDEEENQKEKRQNSWVGMRTV